MSETDPKVKTCLDQITYFIYLYQNLRGGERDLYIKSCIESMLEVAKNPAIVTENPELSTLMNAAAYESRALSDSQVREIIDTKNITPAINEAVRAINIRVLDIAFESKMEEIQGYLDGVSDESKGYIVAHLLAIERRGR